MTGRSTAEVRRGPLGGSSATWPETVRRTAAERVAAGGSAGAARRTGRPADRCAASLKSREKLRNAESPGPPASLQLLTVGQEVDQPWP